MIIPKTPYKGSWLPIIWTTPKITQQLMMMMLLMMLSANANTNFFCFSVISSWLVAFNLSKSRASTKHNDAWWKKGKILSFRVTFNPFTINSRIHRNYHNPTKTGEGNHPPLYSIRMGKKIIENCKNVKQHIPPTGN